MRKRGMLLTSETLKIVIAVICIGFLVYFLANLYFTNMGDRKVKEASSSMENLVMPEIRRIDEGGVAMPAGLHIITPSNWHLMSFTGEEVKPNSCAGENCICICDNVVVDDAVFIQNRQAKRCDDKGVCEILSNVIDFEKIKISRGEGVYLDIQKVNNFIQISEK